MSGDLEDGYAELLLDAPARSGGSVVVDDVDLVTDEDGYDAWWLLLTPEQAGDTACTTTCESACKGSAKRSTATARCPAVWRWFT